jgi:hypothetical protein
MSQLGTATALLLALSAPALAQDATAPPGGSTPAPTVAQVCKTSGTSYKVGEYACIPACHGQRRLARCDASSNTASWTYVSDACPSAMLNAPWPDAWSELPVIADMSPKPVNVDRSAIPPDYFLAFATF